MMQGIQRNAPNMSTGKGETALAVLCEVRTMATFEK